MATEKLRYFIEATWKGGKATSKASADIESVGDAAEKAGRRSAPSLQSVAKGVTAVGVAAGGMYLAAREAWQLLGEGAELEAAEIRFGRLSESIDSTADAMLGRLKQATKGMVSDADLVASASEIMSLGLQDTEDGVVRLATVAGNLGWDMNQVILTMANNSKMRLDALGLSIEDVETRMMSLQEQGFDADKAFDLAVIEAGEAKYLLLGDAADTTAGKMKILEAAMENANDEFKIGAVEGFSEGLGDTADEAARSAENIAVLTGAVGTFLGKLAGSTIGGLGNQLSTKDILEQSVALGYISDSYSDILFDQVKRGRATKDELAYIEKMRGLVEDMSTFADGQVDGWQRAKEETGNYFSAIESGSLTAAGAVGVIGASVSELNTVVVTAAGSSEGLTGTIYDLSVTAAGLPASLQNTAAGIAAVGSESESGKSQVEKLNAELDKLNGRTVEANINLKQRFFDAGGGGGFNTENINPYNPGEYTGGPQRTQIAPGGAPSVNVNVNTTSSNRESERSEVKRRAADEIDRAYDRAGL